MPADAKIAASNQNSAQPPVGIAWKAVLAGEHAAINMRRPPRPIAATATKEGKDYGASGQFDTVGLALSGGGIRSAAFCLGAVQALAEPDMINCIDYLSTVSGGGYTGSSMTAAMSSDNGKFPFMAESDDLSDPQALGHIRNYSNYLVPFGKNSLLTDIAVVVRGLVSNILIVLPILLLAAAATLWAKPTIDSLSRPAFPAISLFDGNFAITRTLAVIGFAIFALLAIYRSWYGARRSELTDPLKPLGWLVLIALAFAVFCEIQPVALKLLFPVNGNSPAAVNCTARDGIVQSNNWVTILGPILAAISLMLSLLARRLGTMVKSNGSGGYTTLFKRIIGHAGIWLVAVTLPLLLWLFYLLFVHWGMSCQYSLRWIWKLFGSIGLQCVAETRTVAAIYAVTASVLVGLWLAQRPNGNSLHRLYRDRLADAFLKDKSNDREFDATNLKLSELNTTLAPYHLINCALNIQGSAEANMRGRNAEFFCFSPRFTGSEMSGYRTTAEFEGYDKALTLATAMATSGAAVSSNMGAASIGPMTPTLALLNLRLGYWLRNIVPGWAPNWMYLFAEIFSGLSPKHPWLYLTDGGHVDNTGIYELLRRRCSTIIAVDAEADPNMVFPSFVKMQRHARIDLGARIRLRWARIAEATRDVRNGDAKPAAGPHCAIGEISYSNGGKGTLIYVKASLTGDENVYILDYARRNAAFPHETTGDQFFNEEQFEVYRALGFHCLHGLYRHLGPDAARGDDAEISSPGVEVNGTILEPADDAVLRLANC